MSNTLGLFALYRVLHLHLTPLGSTFSDVAPADTARPYVVFFHQSGGNTNRRKRKNETHTLIVRCVADRIEDSFAKALIVEGLLHDNGSQGSNTLPADPDWIITTVTQGQLIHLVEIWNGQPLYMTGHQYIFNMEERP